MATAALIDSLGLPPVFLDSLRVQTVGQIAIDETLARPYVDVEIASPPLSTLPSVSDETMALLNDALSPSPQTELKLYGRSGHSRTGLHPLVGAGGFSLDAQGRLIVQARAVNLLPPEQGGRHTLSQLRQMHQTGQSINLGRAMLVRRSSHLTKAQIEQALAEGQLLLPPDAQIGEDGTVHVPVSDFHYEFNPEGFTPARIQGLIGKGKHGLHGLQELSQMRRPSHLQPGEFLVTGMQVAIGGLTGVIDEVVDTATGTFHLGARVLDGMRTTGFADPQTGEPIIRQLELYNPGRTPLQLQTVPIKFYPGDPALRRLARTHVNPASLLYGVGIHHLVSEHPEVLQALLARTIGDSSHAHTLDAGAVFLAGGRLLPYERPPEKHPRHHAFNRLQAAEAIVIDADDPRILRNAAIPLDLQPVTELLDYIGGHQNAGKVMVVARMPDPGQLDDLVRSGIRTFICQYFDNEGDNTSYPYMNDINHPALRRLRDEGVNFVLAVETPDGKTELRLFDKRGFWSRPQEMARLDKVDTIFSFYGSNVEGAVAALRDGMNELMEELRAHFGEALGITHGSGPGIMLLADEAAKRALIARFGVGIGVERLGQKANFGPEAVVQFSDIYRLYRQNMMDSMLTIPFFKVGGLGTLEEESIRICSQKLGRGLVTPMLFVDPFGMGENGEHLWQHYVDQVRAISADGTIRRQGTLSEAMVRFQLTDVTLAEPFNAHYMHLETSLLAAGRIAIAFAKDPLSYYDGVMARTFAAMGADFSESAKQSLRKKFFLLVARGYISAVTKAKDTGFPLPSWYPKELINQLKERWDVRLNAAREGDVVTWLAQNFTTAAAPASPAATPP